jgi:hypothetical protein
MTRKKDTRKKDTRKEDTRMINITRGAYPINR